MSKKRPAWQISSNITSPLRNSSATKMSLENKKLRKIPAIANKNFSILVLASNPLKNFAGIETYANMEELSVNKTKIESFEGAVLQPKLKIFTCYQTPLAEMHFMRIMARIAFGPTLTTVNNVQIPEREIRFADLYADTIRVYIQGGFVITASNPLRIHNPKTKERKTFYKERNFEEPRVDFSNPQHVALMMNKKIRASPTESRSVRLLTKTRDVQYDFDPYRSPGVRMSKSLGTVRLNLKQRDYVARAKKDFQKDMEIEEPEPIPERKPAIEIIDAPTHDAEDNDSTDDELLSNPMSPTQEPKPEIKEEPKLEEPPMSPVTGRPRRGSLHNVTAPKLTQSEDEEDEQPHIIRRPSILSSKLPPSEPQKETPPSSLKHTHDHLSSASGRRKGKKKSAAAPTPAATAVPTTTTKEEEDYEYEYSYYYYYEEIPVTKKKADKSQPQEVVPPIKKADKTEEPIVLQERYTEISTSNDSIIPPKKVRDLDEEENKRPVDSHLVKPEFESEKEELEQPKTEASLVKTIYIEDEDNEPIDAEADDEDLPGEQEVELVEVKEEKKPDEECKEFNLEEELAKKLGENKPEEKPAVEVKVEEVKVEEKPAEEVKIEEEPKVEEKPAEEVKVEEKPAEVIKVEEVKIEEKHIEEGKTETKKTEEHKEIRVETKKTWISFGDDDDANDKDKKDNDKDANKRQPKEFQKCNHKLPPWERTPIHFERTKEIDPDALLF